MKSAKMPDYFQTWSQEKVVGVPEDDLRAYRIKFIGSHRLDRALGPDRHEDRRFDDPVLGD
jgi:hypothetical protein